MVHGGPPVGRLHSAERLLGGGQLVIQLEFTDHGEVGAPPSLDSVGDHPKDLSAWHHHSRIGKSLDPGQLEEPSHTGRTRRRTQ